MALVNPPKDPLEACLLETLEGEVKGYLRSEKHIYANLLNSAPTYMGNQKHKEGLFLEDRSSKDDKNGAPQVELKPLPPHLWYEFFGPN